jgi:starch synthase
MRYGTVPVASRVGGLADTIVDADRRENSGNAILESEYLANGFLFDGETPQQIVGAVARALDAFMRPATWRSLQRNAMQRDYGWTQAAQQYVALYDELTGSALAKTPIELRRAQFAAAAATSAAAQAERDAVGQQPPVQISA